MEDVGCIQLMDGAKYAPKRSLLISILWAPVALRWLRVGAASGWLSFSYCCANVVLRRPKHRISKKYVFVIKDKLILYIPAPSRDRGV